MEAAALIHFSFSLYLFLKIKSSRERGKGEKEPPSSLRDGGIHSSISGITFLFLSSAALSEFTGRHSGSFLEYLRKIRL